MSRGKSKKRKISRYGKYYKKMMEPVWIERWNKYLQRIRKLKKNIIALGPIPKKETQLIKTTNYFINLIDILTDFYDKGILRCVPSNKEKAVCEFNGIIKAFVAREECTICYINKSEVGKRVTASNLCIAALSPINNEDNMANIQTVTVNQKKMKVIVDFTPISEWINGRAKSIYGWQAKISQKQLSNVLENMQSILIKYIDLILEENI